MNRVGNLHLQVSPPVQQIHDSFRAQCLFLIKLYSSHGETRDPRYGFTGFKISRRSKIESSN